MEQFSIKNIDVPNSSIKCLIWGMGSYYQSRKAWLSDSYNILAFIHGDPKFSGTVFEEKQVISPLQLNEYDYDLILVAVSQEKPIVKQLTDLKVPKERIQKLEFSSDMVYTEENTLPVSRPELRLYYFNLPNIGDLLNAFMLDKLFQVKVIQTKFKDADMLAIGSILESIFQEEKNEEEHDVTISEKAPLHIWGTGFISKQTAKREVSRPVKIHALRGALTRSCLSKILNCEINCVLADPGLLASLICPCAEKKYEVGIIPHYTEYEENIFNDMQKFYHNAIVINVKDYPTKVLQQISQCKCIISTSLHGLIIADSYGIPNQWCIYTERVIGNGFKFQDYYSSFGLEAEPYILNTQTYPNLNQIIQNYSISRDSVRKKQEELIKCFPKRLI